MLKVIAQDFIKPEFIHEVLPFYRELVDKTRKEEFCNAYELYVDQQDSGHFTFIEEWPDQAALDIHRQTEHFMTLVPKIRQYQRKEGILLLLDSFL